MHEINKTQLLHLIPYLTGILLFMAFKVTLGALINTSVLIAHMIGVNNENLYLISIGFPLFSILTLSIVFYKKYKAGKFNAHKLTNIPALVSIILISKLFYHISFPILIQSIEMSNYGNIAKNLNIYNLIFLLLILSISCIVFYTSKKENRTNRLEA